jgi:hypothetical protein
LFFVRQRRRAFPPACRGSPALRDKGADVGLWCLSGSGGGSGSSQVIHFGYLLCSGDSGSAVGIGSWHWQRFDSGTSYRCMAFLLSSQRQRHDIEVCISARRARVSPMAHCYDDVSLAWAVAPHPHRQWRHCGGALVLAAWSWSHRHCTGIALHLGTGIAPHFCSSFYPGQWLRPLGSTAAPGLCSLRSAPREWRVCVEQSYAEQCVD